MGIGYVARWGGIIHREQLQGVGAFFVLYCALPALVIRALTQQPLSDIFSAELPAGVWFGIALRAVRGLGPLLETTAPTAERERHAGTRHDRLQ